MSLPAIALGAQCAPLPSPPGDIASVHDYARYAEQHLTPACWAWLEGGSGDEITLRDNIEALQKLRLRQRVLRPLHNPATDITLPGLALRFPLLLAPVACHALAHPEGELATARGAAAMGVPMVVSTLASQPLEAIAAEASAGAWFQLYLQGKRDDTLQLLSRIENAGYCGIVLTVDAPVTGPRNREQRAGFHSLPERLAVNLPKGGPGLVSRAGGHHALCGPLLTQGATWDDLHWLLSRTQLPVILKGVTDPDDAEQAIQAGVRAVAVSNHGGRTLDGLPASITLLPAVARRVGGRVPVLMDGGIRRGTDILKALALGADAVMTGRPYMHGLATAGASGVAHVLHMLRTELEMAMALAGVARADAIDEQVLHSTPDSY